MTDSNKLQIYNNPDIQLHDLISIFMLYKKFLLISIVSSVSFALIYGVLSPNIYQSSAIFEAEIAYDGKSGSSSTGISSAFSEIAGVSMAGSAGNMANLASATINSRDFLKHLIDTDESFLPELVAVEKYDPETTEIIFDTSKYNPATKKWLKNPPNYVQAYDAYQKMISIDVSRKTGFITISAKHQSPVISAKVIELIFSETNSIMRNRDLEEAQASLDYLYGQLNSVNQQDVLNTIGGLIGAQLRKLTLANIKENYLLEPLDSPFVPEYKVGPKRLQILLIGALFGIVFSVISIMIWHFGIRPVKEKKS